MKGMAWRMFPKLRARLNRAIGFFTSSGLQVTDMIRSRPRLSFIASTYPITKVPQILAEFHAIDRGSAQWRELVVAGDIAKVRYELTGKSGLITPERIEARYLRKWEKVLRKRHEHLAPMLVNKLVENWRRARRQRGARKERRSEKRDMLQRVAADPSVKRLIEGTPELADLAEHLTAISTDPVVLQYTEFKAWGGEAEQLPPDSALTRVQKDKSSREEDAAAWQRLSHLLEEKDCPRVPEKLTIPWCTMLGRCVCGPNCYLAWAHGNLRSRWALHLSKKEVGRGRTVLEIIADAPAVLPGGQRHLYHISSKIGDEAALWKVEVVGRRVLYAGETRTLVRTLHGVRGICQMLTRWDLIFMLMDSDKECRNRGQRKGGTCTLSLSIPASSSGWSKIGLSANPDFGSPRRTIDLAGL